MHARFFFLGTLSKLECAPFLDDEFIYEVTDPAGLCTFQHSVQTDLGAPLVMLEQDLGDCLRCKILATACVAICTSGLSNFAQIKGTSVFSY